MSVSESTVSATSSGTMVPKGAWYGVAKIYNLALALIGTATLCLSMWLSATNPGNGGAVNGIIFTLSYFTVWSNIVTAIVAWMLFANPARDGAGFRWIRITALVMITITGLIYQLVLAASANPVGLEKYTNLGYHYVVPYMAVIGFVLFGPRPRFTIGLVPKMMIIPIAWLVYTLLHGAIMTTPPAKCCNANSALPPQNFYPYPFINANDPDPLIPGLTAPGFAGVAINIGVIVVLGLVMALIYLGLDRALSLGRKPAPLGGADEIEVVAIDPLPDPSDA